MKNIARMIASAGVLSTPSMSLAHVGHIGSEMISHTPTHIAEIFIILSALVVTIFFFKDARNREK